MTQVSRFDRLKDPVGVVQAFKLERKYVELPAGMSRWKKPATKSRKFCDSRLPSPESILGQLAILLCADAEKKSLNQLLLAEVLWDPTQ